MRKKRLPKNTEWQANYEECLNKMNEGNDEFYAKMGITSLTKAESADRNREMKNYRRTRARSIMQEAWACFKAGDISKSRDLVREVKSEYIYFEFPDPGPRVGRCDYCQHLVSETSECIDHPRKPIDANMRRYYRALDEIELKYATKIRRDLLKSVESSGAPIYMETSWLDTPTCLLGPTCGYVVNCHCEPILVDRMPKWVPSDFKDPGDTCTVTQGTFLVNVNARSEWIDGELVDVVPRTSIQVETPIFDQHEHMWMHCRKTYKYLVEKGMDPLIVNTEEWSKVLFVGESGAPIPKEIASVLAEIVSFPAIALGLVLRAEVWFELKEKLREKPDPETIRRAVDEKRKTDKSFGVIARKYDLNIDTLKSSYYRRG